MTGKLLSSVDNISSMDLRAMHDILLDAFACVVSPCSAVYVSGPVTTGKRFVDWYVAKGWLLEANAVTYKKSRYDAVLVPNQRELIRVAQKYRKEGVISVVEPSNLTVEHWSQPDYHKFWTAVLQRFICKVIVLDEWQYSVGCAIEFQFAAKTGIPVEEINGNIVSLQDGARMIRSAAEEVDRLGQGRERLKSIAQALHKNSVC